MILGLVPARYDGKPVCGEYLRVCGLMYVGKHMGVLVGVGEGVPFVAPIFVWEDENDKGPMVRVCCHFGPM